MLFKLLAIPALLASPILAAGTGTKRMEMKQATRAEIAQRARRDDLGRRQSGASPVPHVNPSCVARDFKGEAVDTGSPMFDGKYATISLITFDDGTTSYVVPAQVASYAEGAVFRLTSDCTLAVVGPDGSQSNFFLDLTAEGVAQKFGGAYFDPLQTISANGYFQPVCSIGSDDIVHCTVGSLNTFVACVKFDASGNATPTTPYAFFGDASALPTNMGVCVPLTIKAVPLDA